MSQIYKSTEGSPTVATTYVTDSGNAVPAANILNVLGSNGITTSGAGNTVTISLDNACETTGQTVGATTDNITCIDLGATPGTYSFRINVAGFVSAGTDAGDGCGYFFTGVARTDGAAATVIPTEDKFVVEDAAIIDCDVSLSASGNNLVVDVTGVAGDTIEWAVLTNGTFAS